MIEETERARALPAGDAIEDAIDRHYGRADTTERDAGGRRRNNRYSRDIRAALSFLQVWAAPYLDDTYHFTRYKGKWRCDIEGNIRTIHQSLDRDEAPREQIETYIQEGEGDTLPLAICRAVLQFRDTESAQ